MDRLTAESELENRVTGVRIYVAENPLHGREVPMRRKTDRLGPCRNVAQQLAGVARIDGNQRRLGRHCVQVGLQNVASDGFEDHVLDAKTGHVEAVEDHFWRKTSLATA